MELNSLNNPLLKTGGTVLSRGGGLTKKGVSLEKGTSNALGIQTHKKHKVWKIEDFDTENKVAKQEGEGDDVEKEDFVEFLDDLSKTLHTEGATPVKQESKVNKKTTKVSTPLSKDAVKNNSLSKLFSPTKKAPLMPSNIPSKEFNQFSSRLNNIVDYQTPSNSSIGSVSTGMSPTLQMLNRTPMFRDTRVTRQSTNGRVLFQTPSKDSHPSLSLDDLSLLQRS